MFGKSLNINHARLCLSLTKFLLDEAIHTPKKLKKHKQQLSISNISISQKKRYTRFCMIFFNSNRYSCIQFPLEKNRRSWYGAQVCEMTLIQGIFYMFTLKILCAFACKGNMGKPDHEKMESASEIQNVRWIIASTRIKMFQQKCAGVLHYCVCV